MLIFDDATKDLVMVSGENQSAARNISLTNDTSLTYMSLSETSLHLAYGVISPPITISLSANLKSPKLIEFSNKFSKYVQLIPSKPVINIGETSTTFQLEIIDESIAGEFTFYIS